MGLKNRQENFIEELYHEMFTKLSIFAKKELGDSSISEEAVQETFVIACIKIDNLMDSPNPKGWLVNTLKNVIRNIKQSKSYCSRLLLSQVEIDTLSEPGQEEDLDPEFLYSGLVSKEAFWLLKRITIDNCSMLEVAEELGITLEACKKRVQRAKANFRKKYF